MTDALLVAALAVGVGVALVGERRKDRRVVLAAKSVASLCFFLLGLVRFGGGAFGTWMMIGLALCLAGDVLLVWERTFVAGLVAFLLAHGAYAAAFAGVVPLGSWPASPLAAVAGCSALALIWLWPHLGQMRPAVVAYVAVITIMVWGSTALVFERLAPARLTAGALLFYVSDLAVARHRFVAPGFVNRLWGLPLYYLGQLLLATCVH